MVPLPGLRAGIIPPFLENLLFCFFSLSLIYRIRGSGLALFYLFSIPLRAGKAGYYSAVCLETGAVEWMDLEGNSNSGTSAAFLERLRQRRSGPLDVIWDNAPAHRGEAVREYLRSPGLELRLVNPRFHEGRLCRATARTEAPMRPSGAG